MPTFKNRHYFTVEAGEDATKVLDRLRAEIVKAALEENRFNQSKTALALGLSRGTLRHILKANYGDQYIGSRS